jgi:hypothetical protein
MNNKLVILWPAKQHLVTGDHADGNRETTWWWTTHPRKFLLWSRQTLPVPAPAIAQIRAMAEYMHWVLLIIQFCTCSLQLKNLLKLPWLVPPDRECSPLLIGGKQCVLRAAVLVHEMLFHQDSFRPPHHYKNCSSSIVLVDATSEEKFLWRWFDQLLVVHRRTKPFNSKQRKQCSVSCYFGEPWISVFLADNKLLVPTFKRHEHNWIFFCKSKERERGSLPDHCLGNCHLLCLDHSIPNHPRWPTSPPMLTNAGTVRTKYSQIQQSIDNYFFSNSILTSPKSPSLLHKSKWWMAVPQQQNFFWCVVRLSPLRISSSSKLL